MCRLALLCLLALTLSACGSGADSTSDQDPPAGDPSTDKLARILERGTLVLSTDLEYAPQSFAVPAATRPADTRCEEDQLTAAEVSGFDAETGKAVADALGVEPCFVAPSWVEITAGSWGDRWDLSFGSGTIEAGRMEVLHMTQPYYVIPAYAFVPEASEASAPEDLSGKKVGACASCTHELYLHGELRVPGFEGPPRITDAEIVTFATERPGLEATADGELDAFLCADTVGQRAIEDGLALRPVGEPLFIEYASGFVDRGSELDATAFVERVNEIVGELHASGRLRELSLEYFGADYTAEAAAFDLASLDQELDGATDG
jgi:polar amino acid transport system substrate-binding protein